MHESTEDLERLQQLLDDSYASGGPHLREVITPERMLDATALAARLEGMKLLVLATDPVDADDLRQALDGEEIDGAEVLVVSPAVNSSPLAART